MKREGVYLIVLVLVSQVRDVVLMNVYLDLGNPRGAGFWSKCSGQKKPDS